MEVRIVKWAIVSKEFDIFTLDSIILNWELGCFVVLLRLGGLFCGVLLRLVFED